METLDKEQQEAADKIYGYAADLLVNQKRTGDQTRDALIEQGIDEESAATIVSNLEDEIRKAKKDRANKDMLYGALWAIGGTIATLAEVGYIFWGAIVFGAIQFFKGLANSAS